MSPRPNRIEELCNARGLKVGQLAKAVGHDQSYIGRVWRGERNLTPALAAKIAKVLGVAPSDLEYTPRQLAELSAKNKAANLIESMTDDEFRMWLDLGETIKARRPDRAS